MPRKTMLMCRYAPQSAVFSCKFYGCSVTEAKYDVGDFTAIQRLFQSTSPRITGVVQGAMVLRVSTSCYPLPTSPSLPRDNLHPEVANK